MQGTSFTYGHFGETLPHFLSACGIEVSTNKDYLKPDFLTTLEHCHTHRTGLGDYCDFSIY